MWRHVLGLFGTVGIDQTNKLNIVLLPRCNCDTYKPHDRHDTSFYLSLFISPTLNSTTTKTSILRGAPTSTSLSPSNSVSVRNMANPSSSRQDHDDRDRERRHRSDRHSSHHSRSTIPSHTLLLVLSLILAVLAVMLSLPSSSAAAQKDDPATQGLWGYLTPKRSQALVARESSVAAREAEVARREAELLVGAPGGVIPTQTICPVCPTEPAQTIIKEIVQESALT